MLRKVMALTTIVVFLIGAGCASNPTVPDKDVEDSIGNYFNSFDLSNPAVADFTYTDFDGNVLASGTFGRNDDGTLYILETRGAQIDIDVAPIDFIIIEITYLNPEGIIESGPNEGLPYYFIGQTMHFRIDILNLLWEPIGGQNPMYGYMGPSEISYEHHLASYNSDGDVFPGPFLPCGYPIYNWTGVIPTGQMSLYGNCYLCPELIPGLIVTTVHLTAPVFFGVVDIIFYDSVVGIWQP